MKENKLTSIIIGCALDVHKQLGPGLLESTYEACLAHELKTKGLKIQQQKALPIVYNEIKLEAGYRIDLIVEDEIIVEIKSIDAIADIHLAQLLTYLRLKNLRIGLLINFNCILLKSGIKRMVNGY